MEEVGFNSIKIAQLEFDAGVIPITIKRPHPGGKVERKEPTNKA